MSYTISVPKNTPAVIVLQQVDSRYFEEISGYRDYNFDFVIFKKGSNEVIASCMGGINWCRSRSVEVNLEAGEYVVHVRLDSMLSRDSDYFEEGISNWDPQVLKRILAKKAEAYSKASNYRSSAGKMSFLPRSRHLVGMILQNWKLSLSKPNDRRS